MYLSVSGDYLPLWLCGCVVLESFCFTTMISPETSSAVGLFIECQFHTHYILSM